MANLENQADPLDLSEFYLNQESLEKTRALLGLPSYAEQLEKQAAGQTPINPLEAFGILARPVESVTTAPTRAAAGALAKGGGLGDALQAAKEQAGNPPESAPSGSDLARTLPLAGASPDLLGAGLDFALDPTHLIPGIAALGAVGSLKKVRTAAEIASDIEKLVPQSPMGFYSKLERTMAERLPEAGPVQPGQARNLLQGIKAEEITETGILPWLESKQTFTRDDLLKYLESQRLPLEEKELGGKGLLYETPRYQEYSIPGGTNYTEHLIQLNPKPDEAGLARRFVASHWNEKNVLAHARTAEFPNAQGEKVFLVDELQSDWHQKGRSVGYRTEELNKLLSERGQKRAAEKLAREAASEANSKLNNYLREKFGPGDTFDRVITVLYRQGPTAPPIEQAAGRRNLGDATYDALFSDPKVNELFSEAIQKSREFDTALLQSENIARKIGDSEKMVPDAPFKKNWPELMLKRMIRKAIDSGADGIAITPGAVQAVRYNLRKHIESIAYNGTDLKAWDKKGNRVLTETGITKERLPEYIGKEAAEKLLENKGFNGLYSLTGLELELGGEGMKAFYDQMLPSTLKDIGKKYGAKLEQTVIPINPAYTAEKMKEATPEIIQLMLEKGEAIQVPYLRFSDEMKNKIVKQGQPLYQAPVPIAASALLKEWVEKQREKKE